MSRMSRVPLALAVIAAIAATALGTALGAWWLPFAAAVVLGAWARGRRRWRALAAAMATVAAGWALPLAWLAVRGQDVGGVAATVSALVGLPRAAAAGFALGLVVCCLQAVAGAVLGRAAALALAPGEVAK
jgi:hypothetical protein